MVILLGPTGVGKSAAALHLAKRFGGEIISCDSMQVYRGFDIGTDKPTPAMRRSVPHHLLDTAEPSVQFTAADFVREALAAIRLIRRRGRLPFIVGGSGLYLKALLSGLFPGPGRSPKVREKLERRAREQGLEVLRKELEEVDPVYASLVGQLDRIRIIRALEVFHQTGKPISEHFLRTKPKLKGFHLIKIGLKLRREELYRRIEERVDRMFSLGLVDEVRSLLSRGVEETSPPFRALGYKHVLKHLKGEISIDVALSLTKRDTRRFAKRQMTWFKKMEGIHWFEADEPALLENFLEAQLAG
ncbi:MAG: tRNA (adenosine(37)-N6)-dimethylallyltransferase MiaA [Clostridiales bacterium]|nr:tRNA (adenosine(37)-N6)-dimethylallyltransferase MiaA [Clostridiales bacterium]